MNEQMPDRWFGPGGSKRFHYGSGETRERQDTAELVKKLRATCAFRRLALIAGTPEKYPGTQVCVRILDLEATLEDLDALAARCQQLEEALEEIVRMGDYCFSPHHFAEVASAVLAEGARTDG